MERIFNVNDRIIVKSWEEMKKEFGYDNTLGRIPCYCSFTDIMKKYCGKIGTIKKVINSSMPNKAEIRILFDGDKEIKNPYVFSTDMVKPLWTISEDDWVGEMYKRFLYDRDVFYQVSRPYITVVNKRTLKSAVAKCCDEDTFKTNYGCAVAYAKLINEKIPKFSNYKKLEDVESTDKIKIENSLYKIFGLNPIKKTVYLYEVNSGEVKALPQGSEVEVVK